MIACNFVSTNDTWVCQRCGKVYQRRSIKAPVRSCVTGPGDHLHQIISHFADYAADCGCRERIAQMNVWGVEGCRTRVDEIAAWMIAEAKTRGWRLASFPLATAVARMMVRRAIQSAERDLAKAQPG